jgi:hypothetical protein
MASQIAEFFISIGLDGRVLSQGTVQDALAKNGILAEEVARDELKIDKARHQVDMPVVGGRAYAPEGKLIVAEEVAEGPVSWSARTFSTLGLSIALLTPSSPAVPVKHEWKLLFPVLDCLLWRSLPLRTLPNVPNLVSWLLGVSIR